MKKLLIVLTFLLFFGTNSFASNYKLGLENIFDDVIATLKNKRINLVTNQTGKDQ